MVWLAFFPKHVEMLGWLANTFFKGASNHQMMIRAAYFPSTQARGDERIGCGDIWWYLVMATYGYGRCDWFTVDWLHDVDQLLFRYVRPCEFPKSKKKVSLKWIAMRNNFEDRHSGKWSKTFRIHLATKSLDDKVVWLCVARIRQQSAGRCSGRVDQPRHQHMTTMADNHGHW